MHGGDAAAGGIHLHVGIAGHLAAADLAVGRRGALAEAADGVIHIEAAGENFHGILLAGYAGHNARALVVAELEIQGFARVDVAVVRIVVRLIGGSVDIQRVLRLDDRQRAVVRGHAACVVADGCKHGGNRAGLRRINRGGIQRKQGFVRGDTVAGFIVKREQRAGKRRGDLFGIRGDDLRVGGCGQRAGSGQRERGGKSRDRHHFIHHYVPFLFE